MLQYKEWLSRLTLMVISLSLTLFSLELGLRLYDTYSASQPSEADDWGLIFEFSTTRHHRLLPHGRILHTELEFAYIFENNALGMRDRERKAKKRANDYRIFFLGDSFIQGDGVALEDTITIQLENNLNQSPQQKQIEVLNGGVFGYSPMLEYLYLQEVMSLIEPDLVLLGFYLGNDVGDDYFYSQQAKLNDQTETLYFEDQHWPWSATIEAITLDRPRPNEISLLGADHTRLLNLVQTSLKNYQDQRQYIAFHQRGRNFIKAHQDDIRYNLGLINYPVTTAAQRRAYWKISKTYLAKIKTLCQAKEIPVVLVVIPPYETLAEPNSFDEPYLILEEIGQTLDMPVIQLRPAFLAHDVPDLYYAVDQHWTAVGHRLAAEVVERALRGLGLMRE